MRIPWAGWLSPVLAAIACTSGTISIPVGSTSSTADSTASGPTSADGTGTTDATDGSHTTMESSGSSGGTPECTPADQGWWNPAWHQRRALELDTTAFDGPLTNFPVLLRLDAAALGDTWTERGGADLRFRSASGSSALDYEIDDLDADGRLPVWLKVPQVDPGTGSLQVWMYYENPEAPAGSSAAEVWVDHVAVLHLGATLLDSVGAHSGTSQWEPSPCAGACEPRVGIARSFTPELVHEVILDNSEALDFGSDPYEPALRAFSATLWMRSSWFSDYMWGPFLAKGDGTWRVHTFATSDTFAVGMDCQAPCMAPVDSLGNYNLDAAGFNVNDDQWHHLAVTFGPDGEVPRPLPPGWMPDMRVRLYVDGVLAASEVLSQFRVPADAQPVRLGHNASTQNRYRGDLDELRIVGRELSPEWVAGEFAVVDGELLSEGAAEVLCP